MDSDGEIEYLDEDAEIVEQLVQVPDKPAAKQTHRESTTAATTTDDDEDNTPLLVVRRRSERNRKAKTKTVYEDDSDYDPSQDIEVPSPPSRKRKQTSRKSTTTKSSLPSTPTTPAFVPPVKMYANTDPKRKKMNIKIPDYEDPLCLPVKAIKSIGNDVNRLKSWNKACIEHFKHCDTLLKPIKCQTKRSSKTIILKNVMHKETGRTEMSVWSKTCITNTDGMTKSEVFQSLLPKFREKTVLRPFKLVAAKPKKIHHINDVILTKEEHKNGDVLVAYKPQDKMSALYKFEEDDLLLSLDNDESELRRVLCEVTSCRMCAPCYQTSWRGTARSEKKSLECPICNRSTISMYNLLTHVRTHSADDVRRYKRELIDILASVVEYHYKCRICNMKAESIKDLRNHVLSHKGTTMFRCEVGNHMTT